MAASANVDAAWAKRVKRVWMLGTSSNGATKDVLSFDAVLRESHHSELTVTDNPVETGVVISDHAFMAPVRLEIEAIVSDVFFGGLDASGQPLAVDADVFASAAGRAQNGFAQIQALQAAATPFKVQTGLRLYEDMLITSLDADQDAKTGNIVRFRASLRQVIFVSTQTVDYPPRAKGKTTIAASKKVSKGEVKTETATQPELESSFSQMTGLGQVQSKAAAASVISGGG